MRLYLWILSRILPSYEADSSMSAYASVDASSDSAFAFLSLVAAASSDSAFLEATKKFFLLAAMDYGGINGSKRWLCLLFF